MLTTLRAMFGGSQEDAVVQTARNLGYNRTGGTITRILHQTIARMLKRGDLRNSFEMIVATDN
ncbi:MAG: hypothetical protein O3A47_08925 [Chloroflexi bacterium]|nr:hypothetical protein [Chloroflexota bacterium]